MNTASIDALHGEQEEVGPLAWLTENGALRCTITSDMRGYLSVLDQRLRAWQQCTPNPRPQDYLKLKEDLAASFGCLDVSELSGSLGVELQVLAQFVCGWYDLNFREVAHSGHGRLILMHPDTKIRNTWGKAVREGKLVGIAMTESGGGSNVRKLTCIGHKGADGTYLLTGTKQYISRIAESEFFIVFFNSSPGVSVCAIVAAGAEGFSFEKMQARGLNGWSWGYLHFNEVKIPSDQVLSEPGRGLKMFEKHFNYYRPLVSALVLGAAARAIVAAEQRLRGKFMAGDYSRLRDTALDSIARCHANVTSGMLLSIRAASEGATGDEEASVLSSLAKVYGVETAILTIRSMLLLMGAESFTAESKLGRLEQDVGAFLFADGLHDALTRSAGLNLVLKLNTSYDFNSRPVFSSEKDSSF